MWLGCEGKRRERAKALGGDPVALASTVNESTKVDAINRDGEEEKKWELTE